MRDGLLITDTVLAAFDDISLQLNTDAADITDLASTNRWREWQPASGRIGLNIEAEGFVVGSTATLISRAVAGTTHNYRLNYAADKAFSGLFLIAQIVLGAEGDDGDAPQSLRLTLSSAGAITFSTT